MFLCVILLLDKNILKKLNFNIDNIISLKKETVEAQVGDFSKVDPEFNIDKAVNIAGYKTVIAKHSSTGQKMIILDSGKKTLLTENDITNDKIEEKLKELSKKLKYRSMVIEKIDVVDKGYITTYGKRVPYARFNAKVSNFPKTNISGIISAIDDDKDNQRLILSLNDEKHYSQLITSEFYKNVQESKTGK